MPSKTRVHSKSPRMPEVMAPGGLKICREAQDQLEEAIGSVMKAEQQLRENAREVRSELQSCVSRQQEALRSREVWLLGQIELLEQLKTETLQQQLHQLHWLRGQFDAISQQLQSSSSSNDLNNHLTSCMEKLASFSLTPDETPEMSFQADTRSLRQAITSFGCITSQMVESVTSQSPAHQRGQVQSCLVAAKTQMGEIGDLSDWLLTSRPTSSALIGYQSSTNPEDWLMSSPETKMPCPAPVLVDFMWAWGQLRDLEAWLLQDHVPAGRERTSSSCSSSFSIEKIDESELAIATDGVELSDWLIAPAHVAMETDDEAWQQVLKPFQDAWLTSDWLVKPSQPAADCSSCCQTSRSVEIENLGQLKCLKTPTAPAVPGAALEAWLQQAAPGPQTCRANELCSSYADCVCDNNCGNDALSRWLLQQDGRDKNGVPVSSNTPLTNKTTPPTTLYRREQEQKVQAILEAWLHPTRTPSSCCAPVQTPPTTLSDWVAPEDKKGSREECSSPSMLSSPFQNPLDPDLWVVPAKAQTPQPSPAEKEEDKWLLRKRSQAQVMPSVCDLFSCMKVGGDKEKWLHSAPVQM